MGKDDYASTGGVLKLKGSAGITKKKKKSKSKASKSTTPSTELQDAAARPSKSPVPENVELEEEIDPMAGKTEAERRFEERRQKMLDKRMLNEGVKTHKERVEEYNKYLASLSEHHDM
ncbi:hypothetical protein EDC01DRAFT_775639 [Geopyxis carbonaria]|nr:hypothetical protein EDC01DRAFT_775639 [Geopyxis carbonaria]